MITGEHRQFDTAHQFQMGEHARAGVPIRGSTLQSDPRASLAILQTILPNNARARARNYPISLRRVQSTLGDHCHLIFSRPLVCASNSIFPRLVNARVKSARDRTRTRTTTTTKRRRSAKIGSMGVAAERTSWKEKKSSILLESSVSSTTASTLARKKKRKEKPTTVETIGRINSRSGGSIDFADESRKNGGTNGEKSQTGSQGARTRNGPSVSCGERFSASRCDARKTDRNARVTPKLGWEARRGGGEEKDLGALRSRGNCVYKANEKHVPRMHRIISILDIKLLPSNGYVDTDADWAWHFRHIAFTAISRNRLQMVKDGRGCTIDTNRIQSYPTRLLCTPRDDNDSSLPAFVTIRSVKRVFS